MSTPSSETSQAVQANYQVEAVIASGGMGVVMRGKRQFNCDGHVVAMKAPRFNHGQARLRFTREARALATTLQHPRIIRLLDIDATPQGVPYS